MPFASASLVTSESHLLRGGKWGRELTTGWTCACRIIGEESYSAGQDKRFLLDDVSQRDMWGTAGRRAARDRELGASWTSG